MVQVHVDHLVEVADVAGASGVVGHLLGDQSAGQARPHLQVSVFGQTGTPESGATGVEGLAGDGEGLGGRLEGGDGTRCWPGRTWRRRSRAWTRSTRITTARACPPGRRARG